MKVYLTIPERCGYAQRLFGDVALFACPSGIVMDPPVTGKTQSHAMHEIIKALPDPASLVMALSRDSAADLTLDMFPQER